MKDSDNKKLFSEAKISDEKKRAELNKKEIEKNESVYSQILSEAELLGPEKYREAQIRIAEMRKLDKEKAELEKQNRIKQDAIDSVSGKKVEFEEYKPKFTESLSFRLILVFSIIALIGIGVGIYFWVISVKYSKPSSILLSQTSVIVRDDFELIAWLPNYKGDNKNITISTNSSIVEIYNLNGEKTTEVEAGSAFKVKVTYDGSGNVVGGVVDITVADSLTQEQRATCRVTIDSAVKNISFNSELNDIDYRYITQTINGSAIATPINANSGIFKRTINYSIYAVSNEGNLIAIRKANGDIEGFVEKVFTVSGEGDYVAVLDPSDSKHILGFRLASATEKINASLTKYSDNGLGSSIDFVTYKLDKWVRNGDLSDKIAFVTNEGVVNFLKPGSVCLEASVDQYKFRQPGDKALVTYKEIESKIIPISSVICQEYIDETYDKNKPIVKNLQHFVNEITIDSTGDSVLEELANKNDVKNYLIENFVSFEIIEAVADDGYEAFTIDDFIITKNGYNINFVPMVYSKGHLKCKLIYNGTDEGFSTSGYIQFNFDSLSVDGISNLRWDDTELANIVTPSTVIDLADLVNFDLNFSTSSAIASLSMENRYKDFLLKNKVSLAGTKGIQTYRIYELGAPTTKFEVIMPPFVSDTAKLYLTIDGGVISGNNEKFVSYNTTEVDYAISKFTFDSSYEAINANGKPEQKFNLEDMKVDFDLTINVSGYSASDKVIEIYKKYFLDNTISFQSSDESGVIVKKVGLNINVVFPLGENDKNINLSIIENDNTILSNAISLLYKTNEIKYAISNLTFNSSFLTQNVRTAWFKLDFKTMSIDFDVAITGYENLSDAAIEYYKDYIIKNNLVLKVAEVKVGGVSVNSDIATLKVNQNKDYFVVLPASSQGIVNLAFYFVDGEGAKIVSGANYVALNYNTSGVNYSISNVSYLSPNVSVGIVWANINLIEDLAVNFDINLANVDFSEVSSDIRDEIESIIKTNYKNYIIANELSLAVSYVTNYDDANEIDPSEVIVTKSSSIVNVIFPAVKRGSVAFTFVYTKNGTSSEVDVVGSPLAVDYDTVNCVNLISVSNIVFNSSFNTVNITAPYVEWLMGANGLDISFDLAFDGIENSTGALKNAYKPWALNQITLASSNSDVVIINYGEEAKALIEFPAIATGKTTISFMFKGEKVTAIKSPVLNFNTTNVASMVSEIYAVTYNSDYFKTTSDPFVEYDIASSELNLDFNISFFNAESPRLELQSKYKSYIKDNLIGLVIQPAQMQVADPNSVEPVSLMDSYADEIKVSKQGTIVRIVFPAFVLGQDGIVFTFNGNPVHMSDIPNITYDTRYTEFEILNFTFDESFIQDTSTYTNYKAINLKSMGIDFDVVLTQYPEFQSSNEIVLQYKEYIFNNLISLNITNITATEIGAYSKEGSVSSYYIPDDPNDYDDLITFNAYSGGLFGTQTGISGQNAIKTSSGYSGISGFEEASVKKEGINLYVMFPVASSGTLTVSFGVGSYGSQNYSLIKNGEETFDLTFNFNTEEVANYFNVSGLTINDEWYDKGETSYTNKKLSYTFSLANDLNVNLQVENTFNNKFVSLATADNTYMTELVRHYINLTAISGVTLDSGKEVSLKPMVVEKDGNTIKIYAGDYCHGNFTFAFTFNGNIIGTGANPVTMRLYFYNPRTWTGFY